MLMTDKGIEILNNCFMNGNVRDKIIAIHQKKNKDNTMFIREKIKVIDFATSVLLLT